MGFAIYLYEIMFLSQEIGLSGWQIIRNAGKALETVFKFHRTVKLDANATVTVWSADIGATHEPPSNVVMKGQKWFVADNMCTVLLNNEGEVCMLRSYAHVRNITRKVRVCEDLRLFPISKIRNWLNALTGDGNVWTQEAAVIHEFVSAPGKLRIPTNGGASPPTGKNAVNVFILLHITLSDGCTQCKWKLYPGSAMDVVRKSLAFSNLSLKLWWNFRRSVVFSLYSLGRVLIFELWALSRLRAAWEQRRFVGNFIRVLGPERKANEMFTTPIAAASLRDK